MKLVNILSRNRNDSVRTIISNRYDTKKRFAFKAFCVNNYYFFCYNFIIIIFTLNGHIKGVYDTIKILIYFSIYRP